MSEKEIFEKISEIIEDRFEIKVKFSRIFRCRFN